MQKIIGQKPLIEELHSLWATSIFPQSSMIVGPKGSGKEFLALHMADVWGLDHLHYSAPKVDEVRSIIEIVKTLPVQTLFLIGDAHKMNQAAQNALLKTLEEPPLNAIIVLTAETEDSVLPTIRSRCIVFEMGRYTPSDLAEATDDPVLLSVCTNIGQIERAKKADMQNLLDLSHKVVGNLDKISAANTFNIPHHIQNTEDYDLFLETLLHAYRERARAGHDVTKEMSVFALHRNMLRLPTINKTNALEMMLMDLRRARLWSSKHSEKN